MTAMFTRREWGGASAALLGLGASRATGELPVAQTEEIFYFDLHIDTPARLVNERLDLGESREYTHVDIPKMRQGGLNAGFFAVSTPARRQTPLSALKNALHLTDAVVEEIRRHPDDLMVAIRQHSLVVYLKLE